MPVPWKELEPYLRIGPTQSRSHIWTSETLLDYLEFLTEELRTRRKELHLDRSHACLVICDCATQHSMRKYAALKAAWQEHQNCVPYIDISKYDCSFFACSSMSVQKTNRKLECLVMFLFSMKNKQDNMFINRYIPPFSGCVTCLPGDSHRRQRSRVVNPTTGSMLSYICWWRATQIAKYNLRTRSTTDESGHRYPDPRSSSDAEG